MNPRNEERPVDSGRAPASSSRLSIGFPIIALGSLVLLLAVFLVFAEKIKPSRKPINVLLIVADTLRTDHLGCYGFSQPLSPNIDLLAAQGMRLRDYNTVVPSTLASFTALLTSHHTKDHGASRNGFNAPDDLPTLGEAFGDNGYETAAFIASYCLRSEFGISRGFEHFDEQFTQSTILHDNKLIRPATDVTDAFLRWLNGREDERPYFAMVHYFDPHFPYRPPKNFVDEIRRGQPGSAKASMKDINKAARALKESGGLPDDYAMELHALYCAEIRYMDDEIGRIVGRIIDRLEGERETLVVFTADHGETFWEHDEYFSHGKCVYDTGISLPLIFHWPGSIEAGTVRTAPLSNIDLAPTLLSLASLGYPKEFKGFDFSGMITGEGGAPSSDRMRFAEATKPYKAEEGAERPNLNKSKSVRRGPWKYILTPHLDNQGELFNIEEDPQERKNLTGVSELATIAAALRQELERWALIYRAGSDQNYTIDPEAQRSLEGLGY